jgi:hypothetical protein
MSGVAKFLIWSFFILIIDHTLLLAASRYSLPIQPIGIYAAIAGALFLVTVWIERGISPLKDARLFFLSFAALAVLGLIMYRGEGRGPDFGALVLRSADTPSRIGYAAWPVLNLLACASLYLLARRDEYRRTIINAAIVALLIQAAAMEIDMWQPAIFGGFPGRSSGFTQNANDAAFLMTALAALLLPAGSGERLHRFATYGVMIAFAAVLFSQSRTGFLCAVLLVTGLVVAARKASSFPKASPVFVVSYIGVIAATLLLSPVLNVTDKQIMERNARHAEAAKRNVTGSPGMPTAGNLGDPNLDKGVATMKERIQARTSIDGSANLRLAAMSFFCGIIREHPFGLGTGFTNKFATGPHNMWLKLATDEGIAAAILFTIMLGAAWGWAARTRSPALLVISAIALIAALFTQTVLVSPLIPALLAISLGMAQVTAKSSSAMTLRGSGVLPSGYTASK